MKINDLPSKLFTLIMLIILQTAHSPLYVIATNIVAHFNDDDKGLKMYRQEIKIMNFVHCKH